MKISVNSTFSYIKFNLNYGSALQCFALQKYLRERGHNVTLLRDYRANPVYIINRLKNVRYFKLFCRKVKAQIQLQKFIKKYIRLSERGYLSYRSLVKNCPDADCHIVGSDQIWHDAKNFRYLTYVPEGKIKLSYAASFGKAMIPEEAENIIKPYLKSFKKITVREASGVKIINKIGYKAIQVIDPTLLLDWEEYPLRENGKYDYIYCYFLNLTQINDIPYNAIKKIAEEDGKQVFITAPLNYSMFRGERLEFPAVEEWLGFYKNASYIFTNTYHGLLFCIIFRKQFLFFTQKDWSASENERFYSILKLLSLTDRMVNCTDTSTMARKTHEPIDWDQVYIIIQRQKELVDMFFSEVGL